MWIDESLADLKRLQLPMSPITLELRCPKKVGKVSVDPDPDWSLDDLISDLNSLELKLHGSSMTPVTFIKRQPRARRYEEGANRSSKPFVMRVSDDEMYNTGSIGEEIPESLAVGTRFSCSEHYLSESDSSEDEVACEDNRLMVQIEPIEVVLSARDFEYQQDVKEEIRNKVSALERDLMTENERSNSVSVQVQKYKEARREMDKKLDTQYRRRIAEALDNHLIAVQRNHEHRSQLEERKIRNDAAAFEEAKRKEKAIQEEKVRREKAKAETEAAKQRAEDAQKAALDAEKTAKEAAEKEAIETAKRVSAEQKLALENKMTVKAEAPKEVRDIGSVVKAAQSALRTEAERLQKYQELDEKNQAILSSNKDLQRYERQIARPIKQIAGTKENVRAKASELVKIINDPMCPQSISINMFAKKVVSQCATSSANFNSTAFACGHVIVLVTSQVPHAMDILLAEFHRACIYTVPKHVMYSESVLSKEAYYKMMGYHEKDGEIESTEQYLEGVKSYMKLYGALVQTEVDGVQNLHGLKEGWAWLARLLNALPANIYTAVALQAFLEMAGFALCKRYKSQFRKILNVISKHYIEALEARKDPNLNPVIVNIKTYIDTQQFLKEPEGWRLQTTLLSDMGVLEDAGDNQNQYHHQNQYYHHNQYQNQYHRSYRR